MCLHSVSLLIYLCCLNFFYYYLLPSDFVCERFLQLSFSNFINYCSAAFLSCLTLQLATTASHSFHDSIKSRKLGSVKMHDWQRNGKCSIFLPDISVQKETISLVPQDPQFSRRQSKGEHVESSDVGRQHITAEADVFYSASPLHFQYFMNNNVP